MDSFAALFEQSVEGGDFAREGEIITGTVVQVDRDSVVVDIGGKSEGVIALRELTPARRTSSSRARSASA
jgi:small subunit ribosomal protein S1